MREKKIKQFQEGAGYLGSSQQGSLLLGLWGSAGHGGGQMEGTSAEERDIQVGEGTSGRSAGTKKKGCSKQREICASLVRRQSFLFQIPRIGASSLWLGQGASWGMSGGSQRETAGPD